jgi:hypothetical protein
MGKRQRCNCSPTTSEAMTTTLTPGRRSSAQFSRFLSGRRSAATTDTTRGDTHEGAGGGGVTERVRGTCGTALWVRWRSVPVARPCQPPPSRDVGWSTPTNLPPVTTQRLCQPEKRQDGWVEPSPLCGFQDLPAPKRSQARACGDTTLAGGGTCWLRGGFDVTEEMGRCWVFCRGASVS